MKIKIILTFLTALIYWILDGTYKLFYSVTTGVATAHQLDDSLESYVTSKLIREGSVESIFLIMFFLVLVLIWIAPARNKPAK